MKKLALKKKESTPMPMHDEATETHENDNDSDDRKAKRDSIIAKKITDAAKPFGGLRDGGKTRDITITKTSKATGAYTRGGRVYARDDEGVEREMPRVSRPTVPQPRAANDATAVSTVKEAVRPKKKLFEFKKKAPETDGRLDARKTATLRAASRNADAAISAPLARAAKTIAERTDTKLKRMSQQITRGTPAANPNPFKKKS